MFPLYELLSHAELTKPRRVAPESVEARHSARHARCGRLTLFPCPPRPGPADPLEEEPTVLAAISNLSSTGVGLLHSDELPMGLQFEVDWESADETIPLRFEVVHSQPTSAGMYRTGAKLVFGTLPLEAQPTQMTPVAQRTTVQTVVIPDASDEQPDVFDLPAPGPAPISSGVLRFEPPDSTAPTSALAPPGTFSISAAFGFDKTERLDGVTTCGWERSIEMRRAGERLWIYVHSPGKKNGWGIFVDPSEFQAALHRVQESARSPFITTLAA